MESTATVLASGGSLGALLTTAMTYLLTREVGSTEVLVAGLAGGLIGTLGGLLVSMVRARYGPGSPPGRWPLQPGDYLGRWKVHRTLHDQRDNVQAYLVRDEVWAVAKVTVARDDTEEPALTRARNEIDRLDSLPPSPYFTKPLEEVRSEGRIGLVFPHLVTTTLDSTLRDGRILDEGELANLAFCLARAVEVLSEVTPKGLVHRDIQPTNILLDNHGGAVLIDLGLARVLSRVSGQTRDLGTLGYQSPEHFQGSVVPASDLFSVGCCLYAAASGRPPFEGTAAEIMRQILDGLMPDLDAIPHPWARQLIAGLLAPDPADRPSATELATTARRVATALGRPPTAMAASGLPADRPRVLSRWVRTSVAIGAACVVLGGLAAVTLDGAHERRIAAELAEALDDTAGAVQDAREAADRERQGRESAEGAVTEMEEAAEAGQDALEDAQERISELTASNEALATSAQDPSEAATSSPVPQASGTAPVAAVSEYVGLWTGEATSTSGDTFDIAYVVERDRGVQVGAPIGASQTGGCRAVLRFHDVTDEALTVVLDMNNPQACTDAGEASMQLLADEEATVDWSSPSGTDSSSGTMVRRVQDPGSIEPWPTSKNDRSSAINLQLGACAAGGGCGPNSGPSRWSACGAQYCVVGMSNGAVDIFTRDGLSYLGTLDSDPDNALIHLALVGVDWDEALAIVR